ncbi:MAG: peptide deformylase [Candidatus Pelethousia sp.]|nr:peptide deformylase [Candidatus Pelethousia sp.]
MAKRKIYTDDAPCLSKVCRPIERFDERLSELIDDMAETMYGAEGCGLAASQIGILRRVVVIDCGDGLVELVNPQIIETSGEEGRFEGCLSLPGQSGYVLRPTHVKVRAFDRKGDLYEYDTEGLFARAVMHETDHLDGKLYTRLVTEPPEGYSEENEAEGQGAE